MNAIIRREMLGERVSGPKTGDLAVPKLLL
jgi:hypothetical protein